MLFTGQASPDQPVHLRSMFRYSVVHRYCTICRRIENSAFAIRIWHIKALFPCSVSYGIRPFLYVTHHLIILTLKGSFLVQRRHYNEIFGKKNAVNLVAWLTFEPAHDKTYNWHVRPAKADQPGHPPRLIRVFAVRIETAWVLSYPLSAHRKLWSNLADAQADLSLRWTHMPFCIGSFKIYETKITANCSTF